VEIESQRAKEIDACLSGKDASVGKWPIEIGGEKQILEYHTFPFRLLRYNANNGRLAMDVREWRDQNGRDLDADQEEDARILREMLINLDPDKSALLKNDLRLKGQMEPGVITYDGIVINGNRRMALLERLHEEVPTGKYDHLEAVRLPRAISEPDLWKIEAGLQLSRDKVAEYHPVNALLKIKEGVDRGLTVDEVAAAMYAWNATEIKEALERLELIEAFLEFFGQPRNYGLIRRFGLSEYFVDIQKRVKAPAVKNRLPKRELRKRLAFTFALIRAGILIGSKTGGRKAFTHWDIRNLDKVFSDYDAGVAFTKKLEEADDMRSVPKEEVVECFQDAREILSNKEERDEPVRLMGKAIHALEAIDTKTEHFRSESVKKAAARLSELVEKIQKELAE